MDRFTEEEEGTDTASERLEQFSQTLWKALVPPSGESPCLQGELVRANNRLWSECLRNGMGNYYDEWPGYYADLVQLIVRTLVENRGGALATADVVWFKDLGERLARDHAIHAELHALEVSSDPNPRPMTPEELARFDELANDPAYIHWEVFCRRAQRCIANWCLANPDFEDRSGRPVRVRGYATVHSLFESQQPAAKCPKCNGRGWVQPDETKFPSACECAR